MSKIRRLAPADILPAMYLSRAAGWNQVPDDWMRLLELEPEGCFGVEEDGRLAATTTAVCFGQRLAWIGMVLTDPAHRRQGHARRLMEHALEFLHQRQVEWIKLDATEMGHPLYLELGFEDEGSVERWAAVASWPPRELPPYEPEPHLDLAAFGADRGALLACLAAGESGCNPGLGFAMGRPGANAFSFGPSVARDPETARLLLEWFLGRHPGETVYWDLLPENREAVRLAREFQFEPRRKLLRMVRPGASDAEPLAFDNSLVYATAGFEYG